jgi:NAD(P)-dependent dehydrogenase (short-subunit alcohol dehydrogenase family)
MGLTLPMSRDLARDGVRVVSIMPGLFETPMYAKLPKKVQERLNATTLFPGRLGRPADYASLALHICENEMLNGACIRLDGAVRLPPS